MPGDTVSGVDSVLVDRQINVVRRLNEITHGTGVICVAARESRLVRTWGKSPRQESIVPENRGEVAGVMSIDGIEVEILKAERDVELVAPYRAGAFA